MAHVRDHPVSADGRRNDSASVRRALAILIRLADEPFATNGGSIKQLSDALQIPRSTVQRLLQPLIAYRLVAQGESDATYRLDWGVARLGASYLDALDIRRMAHPILVELSRMTEETVYLVIPDLPYVVYVDKVDSRYSVRMHAAVGARQPAYCTGVGKAILAYVDSAALRATIAAGTPRHTPHTLTTLAEICADLEITRQRGYAIDNTENETDVRCCAAPIFDYTGSVAASVSVAAPVTRLAQNRVEEISTMVTSAAREISLRLGNAGGCGRTQDGLTTVSDCSES